MNELLSLKNVSVSYGPNAALESVSLNVYADDFLGIIGPNGGGKTTLVKAMIGAVKYTGEVKYDDEILNSHGKRIGYLPQQNNFDYKFPISVIEIVLSGLQGKKGMTGLYKCKDRRKAMELLDTMGVSCIADRPVGQLSGGQVQRTLLCRSLISDPKLLILDEPANFVDSKFEKELYDLLREFNKKMAIIMVSHDLGTITSVVKNMVCVNRHVHRHNSNLITTEQLQRYNCPIQIITHGEVPYAVLKKHD